MCARREIEEETGITSLPPHTSHLRLGGVYLYVFDLPQKYPVEAKDTREIEDVRWYTMEEMKALRGNKSMMEYIERQERRSQK